MVPTFSVAADKLVAGIPLHPHVDQCRDRSSAVGVVVVGRRSRHPMAVGWGLPQMPRGKQGEIAGASQLFAVRFCQ